MPWTVKKKKRPEPLDLFSNKKKAVIELDSRTRKSRLY